MRMIALVSDQRMQNILPLLQEGVNYEELVLVLSKERGSGQPARRFVDAAHDTAAALGSWIPKVTISDTYLDPYSIESSKQVIESLIGASSGPRAVIVNISGGTKPMAIGALQAAQVASVACLYTDTENGELIQLGADGTIRPEPISVPSLDVATYIRAYGERVERCEPVAKLAPSNVDWAEAIADEHETIYKSVIVQIMRQLTDRSAGYPIAVDITATRRQRQVIAQLASRGLWDWDEMNKRLIVTSQDAADLINGGWVEAYVAHQMQRSGHFQDVRMRVTLRGIEGEIDVAAVCNGKLVLIECKSNLRRIQQLSTLVAFRTKLGGPFAHAYYARAADDNRKQIKAQCDKFKLNGVFFGAELRMIGKQIGERMGGT